MGPRSAEIDDQSTSDGTPEDVAVLYSWANLHGAKYRDYSASRREHRAQVRHRAARALLERELKAQAEAELSAQAAERDALAAEAAARTQSEQKSESSRVEALHSAEAARRKAAAERVEAARRTEAAALATVLALREEREITEAHASAQQQARIYTESELRRRQLAGPQPRLSLYEANDGASTEAGEPGGERLEYGSQLEHVARPLLESELAKAPHSSLDFARERLLFEDETDLAAIGWPYDRKSDELWRLDPYGEAATPETEQTGPAWLYASQTPPRAAAMQPVLPALVIDTSGADKTTTDSAAIDPVPGDLQGGDTLQDSRERVAARWFALKDIFERSEPDLPTIPLVQPGEQRSSLLAVFSLAGGVGKTNLVATLGRAFSLQGERVVLTDTTTGGVLPFYFGARELRAGVVRTFQPPAEKTGEPISLVVYDTAGTIADDLRQNVLAEEILRNGAGNHRLLLDLSSGSSWLVQKMVKVHPLVLVPLTPDLNSVLSLQAVERLFRGMVDPAGRPLLPYYLLNRFDAALPLHLDVREVLRRRLGDRLLPFAIRHSAVVSEALAEGMTVVDYAPAEAVTQDFLDVATWLRSLSPPVLDGFRSLRWGER